MKNCDITEKSSTGTGNLLSNPGQKYNRQSTILIDKLAWLVNKEDDTVCDFDCIIQIDYPCGVCSVLLTGQT